MQLTFAYGSNLSEEQMKKRCPNVRVIEVGYLKGYRLSFTHYSTTWKSGVADVVEDSDSEVWGLVYEISERDLESLDSYEGYPDIYKRFKTSIKTKSRTIPDVWVYAVVKKASFIEPTEEYLRIIKSAAVKLGFPETYSRYFEKIQTVKCPK